MSHDGFLQHLAHHAHCTVLLHVHSVCRGVHEPCATCCREMDVYVGALFHISVIEFGVKP